MNRRTNKRSVFLILTLVISAFSFDIRQADAAAPVSWKTAVHLGDTVSFSGRNWTVLDPDTGYLTASDLDAGGSREFDSDNNQLFNPGNGNNIASWLNGYYYNQLADHLWIQSTSWNIGNEQAESAMTVPAHVGLLSYYESRLYRPYLGTLPDRYWLITPQQRSPFYVWYLNTNGSAAAITANTYRAVRPALHLKSALSLTTGSGTPGDPYVIINQTPEIELSHADDSRTISTQSGSESFSITGKVSDGDGGDVTVSATLGGVTKTALVPSAPKTMPGAENFTLTWNTSTDHIGNGTVSNLSVKADDGNGADKQASYTGTITVDTIGPNQPAIQFTSPAGYTSGSATKDEVTSTVIDGTDSGTGVQKSQYRTRLNGGGWSAWTDYRSSFTVSQEGLTDIEALTFDKAGNISASRSAQVLVDKTVPMVPALNFVSPPGYTSGTDSYQNVTFTVSNGTDTGSGVLKSQYRTSGNDGIVWSSWTDYTIPVSISNAGKTAIEAKTIDKAGNESDSVSAHVQIIKAAPTAANVAITGTPAEDQTLTGSYSYADMNGDAENGSTYHWYRSDDPGLSVNHTLITGAVSRTYVLKAEDVGKYISFEVTPRNTEDPSAGAAVESTATDMITAAPAAPVAANVVITGQAVTGQTLTGSYQYSDVNGDAESGSTYQWYSADDAALTVNHTAIAGATDRTYVLQAADAGKYISFKVTPRNAAVPDTGTAVESAGTAKIALAPAAPIAANVMITGQAVSGQTLTGAYQYSDVNGDAESGSTFQWYRSDDPALAVNHTAIAGATDLTYVLQAADAGKYISFEVTPRNTVEPAVGTAAESAATSLVLTGPTAPTAAMVKITGTEVVGETLSGSYSYADANGDAENGSTYQWYRSDDSAGTLNHSPIAGANSLSYTLQKEDEGKYISFEITPKNAAEPTTGTAAESALTAKVVPAPAAPVAGSVSVTGKAVAGQTLTGSYLYADVNGDAESGSTYQWYRSDDAAGTLNRTAITDAVGRNYVLQAGDVGKYITFEVTPKNAEEPTTGMPVESAASAVIEAAPVVPPGSGGTGPTGPTSPSSPDPSVPAVPVTPPTSPSDAQVINASSLMNGKNGKVEIEVTAGRTSVLLPIQAATMVGSNNLVLLMGDLNVTLPSEVLSMVQGLLKGTDAEGAQILFEASPLQRTKAETLVNGLASKGTRVSQASEVFDFRMVIIKKDGTLIPVTVFQKPITIAIKVKNNPVKQLTHIYYLSDNGKMEYVGGTWNGDVISSQVTHFSKYAALEISKSFADVPADHWASAAIQSLAAKQIVTGITDKEFRLGSKVTRAEFTALLVRALGLKAEVKSGFGDVPQHAWYAGYVDAAVQAGIVTGQGQNTFAPERTISREEMAVMLIRALEVKLGKKTDPAAGGSPFADASKVSVWAASSVNAAAELGLIQGKDNHLFDPKGWMTRAEGAQVIYQLLMQ